MFSSSKKDYYSVNADISLSPTKTGSLMIEDTEQIMSNNSNFQGSPSNQVRDVNRSMSPPQNDGNT